MRRHGMVLVLCAVVTLLSGCGSTQNALVLGVGFRKAEHAVFQDPAIRARITDAETKRKINAAEGTYDTALNCGFDAYEAAAAKTPEGQDVVVTSADYKSCMSSMWKAGAQLLQIVRAFKPDWLGTALTVDVGNGNKVTLTGSQFESGQIPADVALAPTTKNAAARP